jgi:hypothetical protein
MLGTNTNNKEVQLFVNRLKRLTPAEADMIYANYLARIALDPRDDNHTLASLKSIACLEKMFYLRSESWMKACDKVEISLWGILEKACNPVFEVVGNVTSAAEGLVLRSLISIEVFETLIQPVRFLLEELNLVKPLVKGI